MIRGGTAKRKRDESDGEQAGTSKEQRKKAKREKGEKLPPLPTDLIQKMKALIDYIVEYEDKYVFRHILETWRTRIPTVKLKISGKAFLKS